MVKKKILNLVISISFLFTGFLSCNSNNPSQSISGYQSWIEALRQQQYTVTQGNAYLMTNTECPTYVDIFNSCFGQNPASPYIIPQPPIEDSYVDPYYAEPLNTAGPQGSTNIIYRLSDNDALVTIIAYPPKAAYLGYQSYAFTRETSFYDNITSPRPRVLSPDPSRYEIFGSLGNDVNNILVENQYGAAPWGGNVIMFITTPNQTLAETLINSAKNEGIQAKSIFVEPVGSNINTGNDSSADDLITLMRYAVPEDASSATLWQNSLSQNVLVYKVTNDNIAISRFGTNQYTAHTINTDETNLITALQQLSALLQTYLADTQAATLSASTYQTQATTEDDSNGIPSAGLVGAYCISNGTNCEGDNQDTSTYATLLDYTLLLGPEETAFIAGINHSAESLNNSRYVSIDVYYAENSSGVASASQTNLIAAGFESGNLLGSAEEILLKLGITIPTEDAELREEISKLYVSFVARNCDNSTIATVQDHCIDLQGSTLVPLDKTISITERSYILPGSTTGAYVPQMVYPFIISATHNFIANP